MNKKDYKICVYAITKNEEQFAEKWYDNMSEADYVVVLDTGSTDRTVEILKDKGAIVEEKYIKPWRFDVARNESMKLIPKDADIAVCTDLDELFEPGWAQGLRDSWKDDTDKAKYLFSWSHDEEGNSAIEIWYEKIHANTKDWYWAMPVHEALTHKTKKDSELNISLVPKDRMHLHHYPDTTKSRSNYLSLMELALAEHPNDFMQNWYYGRELYFHQRYQDAVHQLERVKKLPTGEFRYQKSASLMYLAKAYEQFGNYKEAEKNYILAKYLANDVRDPLVRLLEFYYRQQRWYACVDVGLEVLTIKGNRTNWYEDSANYRHVPHDYLSIAYYNTENYKKSLEHINKALEYKRNDKRLLSNKEIILEAMK